MSLLAEGILDTDKPVEDMEEAAGPHAWTSAAQRQRFPRRPRKGKCSFFILFAMTQERHHNVLSNFALIMHVFSWQRIARSLGRFTAGVLAELQIKCHTSRTMSRFFDSTSENATKKAKGLCSQMRRICHLRSTIASKQRGMN
jgi:hypothetical protein